jgi:hypothetical protein
MFEECEEEIDAEENIRDGEDEIADRENKYKPHATNGGLFRLGCPTVQYMVRYFDLLY